MAFDYRSAGSLTEWIRCAVARDRGINLDELLATAAAAPRGWQLRTNNATRSARRAVQRLALAGEIEIVDGRVFPTERKRTRYR